MHALHLLNPRELGFQAEIGFSDRNFLRESYDLDVFLWPQEMESEAQRNTLLRDSQHPDFSSPRNTFGSAKGLTTNPNNTCFGDR